ncbi:hypothetical protein O7631_21755 [Micromonospora sp. WMMD967]|uniref:hypothetical protein n=1 Tax=Micromonospora sp. WMMD967 TaxID=3016101 RepID=UPI002417E374|nr:hypothetical protein [Micromonospora sp. WMMD967]MDG4839152.1 hypothetical protein [Micromonospora sp. WMMD967]
MSSRSTGQVRLRQHATLVPVQAGQVTVSVSVGPHGEAIALWSSTAGREALLGSTLSASGVSRPDSTTRAGVAVQVATYSPQARSVIAVPDLALAHCHVQPLPGGRMLLVGARSRRLAEGVENNAVIVDADGTTVRRGTLGDGIEHVQTTRSGRIWVGYFDEGVCGGSDGSPPLGAPGIVRFTSRLVPEWHFPDGGVDPIDDCYALNVTGETAWATYYSDFPVVRIAEDTVRSWPGGRTAARALIVDDTRCALIGGYGEHHDRILVGNLDHGHFRRYRLVLPNGRPLPRRTVVIGRGAELHAFVDTTWLRVSLPDLP